MFEEFKLYMIGLGDWVYILRAFFFFVLINKHILGGFEFVGLL